MDDEKLSVEETGPVKTMDDEKLSVEETGTEPWVFDKATQTDYYNGPEEVVHLGRNVVRPPNYNQENLLNAQRLDYRNGIQTGGSPLAMRQINPAILEPRTCDRETQTADDDNTEGEDIGYWRNAVNQRKLGSSNYNKGDPDLEYGNRIPTGAPSSAVRQNHPENCSSIAEIPHQNLQNQAISSSTINVSEVHEGHKLSMDYYFAKFIQKWMERVPQEKKMACIKKVLSIMKKYTSS